MVRLLELTPETPATETQGNGTLAFLAALAKIGVGNAVTNLSATPGAVVGGDTTIPYLVSVKGGGRCYVSSFTRMYMDGAADMFRASKDAVLRLLAPGALAGGAVARALGMDDVVTLNNNLYPTCHVPEWASVDVAAMTSALTERYPRHAIWARSMTEKLDAPALARLREAGYILAPSRPVEIFDPTPPGWKAPSNISKDFKSLRKLSVNHFTGGPFGDDDFAAMEQFSQRTTVDRHSPLMPVYTAAFFRACASSPDFHFELLRDYAGTLVGFASVIVGPSRITCGSLGYDLDHEDAQVLYRVLNAIQMQRAMTLRLPYNIGYGAQSFKRLRGTAPSMEMNAVYVRHLPLVKRQLWKTTLAAVSRVAGSVIERL